MKLNTLHKGQSATVTSIDAQSKLKDRLNSFGLLKGATVLVLEHSLTKQTMEIRINNTRIALRSSEAAGIEVQ